MLWLIGRFRYGALECVEQLHRAGFHHGDIAARNFGVRNREMVVFDFSHAEPCGRGCPSAADGCFSARREVETLNEKLFGVAEA
jgi:tRNA A-37 threonylcarbamoyl transferase component Bud32